MGDRCVGIVREAHTAEARIVDERAFPTQWRCVPWFLERSLLSILLIPSGDFQPSAVRVTKLVDFWEGDGRRMIHVGNERFQRLHIERGDVEKPCQLTDQGLAMSVSDQKVGGHGRAFRDLGHRCLVRPNNPMGDVGGRAEIDHVFGAPRDAVPED